MSERTPVRRALPVLPRDGAPTIAPATLAGVLAFLPAAALLVMRVGINAPVGPDLPYGAVYDPVALAAVVGPALGALVLAAANDNAATRIAMAFAGVFGLLTAVARPASVPAAVALVGAVGVVALARVEPPFTPDRIVESIVGLAFLAGVAISMVAFLGVHPALTRPLGSNVALLAVAGAPVFVDWDRRAVFVGALAAAAFAGFAVAAPFVAGAASLIAGGIVGVSLPILVLAVFGGVTLAATGLRRGHLPVAIAGAAVLAAGVPATVPRTLALTVGLGIVLTHHRP